MKAWKLLPALILILSTQIFAQLTKDDVREILIIQGEVTQQNLEEQTEDIYNTYIKRNSYKTTTLINALSLSALSGFCMGNHQSRIANYTHTEWMPGFMDNWYQIKKSSGMKQGTWEKVWRDADYLSDRMAYNEFNKFFGGNSFFTYAAHSLVKNFFAYMVRHKTKYGNGFL